MNTWFGGTPMMLKQERRWCEQIKRRIHSYHYVITDAFSAGKAFNMKKEGHKVKLFLDSGAFSAYAKGVEIDLKEYIKFIKENLSYIEIYANLDVIGDPKATLKNQKEMEAAGLSPIPCFHRGEPWKYYKDYLAKYDYVALGGIARVKNRRELTGWLDECFSMICDAKGVPQIKVHGFAVTSHFLLWRYPWYSVDSTSWVMTSRTGCIIVPPEKGGKWRYDVAPWKVFVSEKSPTQSQFDAHYSSMAPTMQKVVDKYVKSKGFTVKQAEVEYAIRDRLCIAYFQDLEKAITKKPPMFGTRKYGMGLM